MTKKVVLRPAFEWTCPECGRDKFERGIVAEMSQEELQEMREDFGVETVPGDFMAMPEWVSCEYCQMNFDTLHFSEDA